MCPLFLSDVLSRAILRHFRDFLLEPLTNEGYSETSQELSRRREAAFAALRSFLQALGSLLHSERELRGIMVSFLPYVILTILVVDLLEVLSKYPS